MKDKILKNISKELKSRIDTKAKAMYLLVEIRKILELSNYKGDILYIFCNWVLHSKLDYPKTKKYFSGKFDPYIDNKTSSKDVGENILSNHHDFFILKDLKNGLDDFFTQNNLQNNLTNSPGVWVNFVRILLEILKECPIIINSPKIDSLSLTEDKNGISCYRFLLKNKLLDKRNVIKIKIKIKETM